MCAAMAFVAAPLASSASRGSVRRKRPGFSPRCVAESAGGLVPSSSSNSRRAALQGFAALCLSVPFCTTHAPPIWASEVAEAVETSTAPSDFKEYRGPVSLGFSFAYPSGWNVKKKPLKTHLSEVIVSSNTAGSTSAGLVVDQVKINSIDKFGSAAEVGDKVVKLEQKKDGVTSAELLASETETKGGLTYYRVDYVVESSRGAKRYLAKATITAQQLYVFTAQSKVADFDHDTAATLERMLQSFSVKPQYL